MRTTKLVLRSLAIWVLMFVAPASLWAQQEDKVFSLTAEGLADGKTVDLSKRPVWAYHAGDDAAWAARDFDDSDWARVKSNWQSEEDYASISWQGRAWFRVRVGVDESLANQPLALRVWQAGATEIYIDGKLLHRFGVIKPESDEEYNPRGLFVPVVFASGGEHTIAVRYSFMAARDLTRGRGLWLARANHEPGFSLVFASGNDAAFKLENSVRENFLDYAFVGLLYALGLVHFLLFVFYRRERGNLFYSLFAAGFATTLWLSKVAYGGHLSATAAVIYEMLQENIQSLAVLSLLAFLYVEFVGRVSRFFWMLLAVCLLGIALTVTQVFPVIQFTPVMLVVALADCLRIMWGALKKTRAGAWIVAAGIGVFFLCVIVNIATGRRFIIVPEWLLSINFIITILSIPLAVSIYLARNFARTNLDLQTQLTNVKDLSVKQIEQERRESELRVEHERTQAENQRRAQELEEARTLQLSMLPRALPNIANLEIAAYMKPATEVGGDYYDFHTGDDGTLTVVIGDATGHGLKAGTVVTATKSLFNHLADKPDITNIFKHISRSLKRMNLRGLFMAMTMVKIKDGALSIGVAGMPSALIHRHATNTIEEIAIRAVPLGSLTNFAYKQQELTLQTGDTMILMSDGFPEMFNDRMEMLGYEAAEATLRAHAHLSAQEVINRFVETGEAWAQGRAQDDDVTFVVLKVRE
ncbi:MAG: SpoIIE family protein phosphatase [Pyrinomonadaceae bacterium MAG19_C2-C3]|nr:SpoIIE family protein phosphatase [Pyrinomonadaceae bacterium MAG19_C2-C3]